MFRLAKTIKNKIKNKAGESIAETLVALLIAALALTMLAGAVMSGTNMIWNSRERLKNYYGQAEGVATFNVTGSPAPDKATIDKTGSITINGQTVDITAAKNTAFSRTKVVAFKKR